MGTASPTQTHTRLSGVQLRLAQAAWWVIAGLTVSLLAVAISIRYNRVADIGAGLTSNAAGEIVLSPVISDLPAGQAGILEGDILVAVDGLPIIPEMRSNQINFLLSGPIGSPVNVSVRTGDGLVREYTLARAMGYSNRFQIQLGLPVHFVAAYIIAFDLAVMLAFAAVAALLFWRRSDDWMAVFVSITLVTLGASTATSLNNLATTPSDWGWAASSFVAFSRACGFSLLYLFPDGRFMPRWARALVALHVAWAVAQFFVPSARPLNWPYPLYLAVYLGAMSAGFLAQLYRYWRVSTPSQRQQTKWVVLGMGAFVAGFAVTETPRVLIPALAQPSVPALLYGIVFYSPVSSIAWILLALSFGVSMLRYRLYDVDFAINRSLVYGALTVLLAAVFGGSLYIVSLVTQGQQSILGFGVAAVAVGLLFQPARRRLQRFVDQRFYNIQIDYQKTPPPNAPAPTSVTSVLTQTRFGAYTGLELVGRGGMAEVYKSIHPTLGKPVAIKLLPARLAADPDFRHRFQREAQVVSKLQHPNIVRLFDFGEDAEVGTHYMVMEYLAGKDLGAYLREVGRLSLAQALPVIQQIASALDYAHAQGLVHRDIKPSNVMLDTPSPISNLQHPLRAVLTDFGIAKIRGGHTAVTRTGGVLGTFDYIAPEQIEASANVDGRADVYAFGVLTYEMLSGELPFKHGNIGALLLAHLTQPPPDPRDLAPELSSEAARAIRRAMAKGPDERFATAGEFAAALG